VRRLVLLTAAAVVAACGGGPSGSPARSSSSGSSPISPAAPTQSAAPASVSAALPSAEELCKLLTSADWGQFNYVTTAQPEVNSDGPGSAYCTYAGESGGEGGLELDSFVGESVADAEETFDLIAAGSDGGGEMITIPGSDEAFIDPSIGNAFGAVVVRTGRFTYTLSLPAGEQAQPQLLGLAGIVLARAAALR
jgi:hypothetical protein